MEWKYSPDAERGGQWFEQMYVNRSRNAQLESDYLSVERRTVERFVKDRKIPGPSLEIGCGSGIFADLVPGYIGLEYSFQALCSQGFDGYRRLCGDASRLPFRDASLACILSFNTLEHVPKLDLAFSEMDRVLRPGGWLILKPAWHCTRHTTELIPVLPYSRLNLRQKGVKLMLPILSSKAYKFATKIPWRIWRRSMTGSANSLAWKRLRPYQGEEWIPDADATASIDCHEGILYYVRKGYVCHSHPGVLKQVLAGHDMVMLQKLS
jgi:SAM-dependent methyltransferase